MLFIGVLVVGIFVMSCSEPINEEGLVRASAQGKVAQVKKLLAEGVDVDVIAIKEWTPLTAAAKHGHMDVVRVLLIAGARIDRPAPGGVTALFFAVVNGHSEVVKYLLLNGADPNIDAGKMEHMRAVVMKDGYHEIAMLLKEHGFLLKFDQY